METTTVLASKDLRHTISVNNSKANILINIRLNDECKNGHQDFSITATTWKIGKQRTERNCTGGGCCHDEILKARPDLQLFVNLHLCDYLGVRMYAVENGFYHMTKGFDNISPNSPEFASKFCEYYRITAKQFEILSRSENKLRYALNLDRLGILAQWKEEADKAIKQIEEWTGKEFLVDSPKSHYNRPTAEQIAEEDTKTEAGFYSPEKIAERINKAKADADAKKYADILAERDEAIKKAEQEYNVKKAVLDGGLSLENFIFYNHTQQGCFNWMESSPRTTSAQFEEFVKKTSIDGVTWKLK